MDQVALLGIVQTWRINPKPEWRGFRCANCQRHLNGAWHHWLKSYGYRTPVHFCSRCEKEYLSGNVTPKRPGNPALASRFYRDLPEKAQASLRTIAMRRHPSLSAYKTFSCDQCGTSVHKAYHIWTFLDRNLVETHLCRRCGDALLKG